MRVMNNVWTGCTLASPSCPAGSQAQGEDTSACQLAPVHLNYRQANKTLQQYKCTHYLKLK